jgi:hypothetical protein
VVELDKGHVTVGGKLGAESGLAGAPKTDERYASEAQILFRAEVAHEASSGFFEAMAGEALDKAQDGLLLRGVLLVVLLFGSKQFFE